MHWAIVPTYFLNILHNGKCLKLLFHLNLFGNIAAELFRLDLFFLHRWFKLFLFEYPFGQSGRLFSCDREWRQSYLLFLQCFFLFFCQLYFFTDSFHIILWRFFLFRLLSLLDSIFNIEVDAQLTQIERMSPRILLCREFIERLLQLWRHSHLLIEGVLTGHSHGLC